MALTEVEIRSAKAHGKPRKLFDSGGLFLLVSPSGGRLWRLKFRIQGKEKLLSLGRYPEISLKVARERRDAARRQLALGSDPTAQRRAEKVATSNTLHAVALEWLNAREASLNARVHEKRVRRFEQYVFPLLGSKPIAAVKAPDLLSALRRIEARGKHETAHRLRSECGALFRYAIATGRADSDPASALRGALAPVVVRNHPSITDPAGIGELLRAIWGYRGHLSTEYALKILPLVFVRPGELRLARWSEFDLDGAMWRIPAERMKMREAHLVPLSKQAAALFRELRDYTGDGELVFPSVRSNERPISNNTLNAALRRLGFSGDQIVSHGFRSMASTSLNEQGWHPDLIELQLAHADRNEVRAAYNRAQRIVERRKMLQSWADYLEGLRTQPRRAACG